ncbi:16S rRNA (cytosine(1402)-N(4))-methyltransferase RsmH [Thermosynechococcaceae cyanobacterium BACA0444]|uniref:Ribosomal RNA small subunit methyltransferase H n=1 Tax=Pseudocalidococcus azoricus BACA0444 TaxID=2918990 RepID=A0AAE4FQX2_9CYAN|nr:16S rRNA (cytosine(1402)-N(4))-methyltransferase RsmH [Pseudocalidococcus azoricus]MDS3859637.1 16S rRNA (cytosine(1402)-N(4))-methyltransferase RsmH [Pseudocalidococcus azoricus BACA0444]
MTDPPSTSNFVHQPVLAQALLTALTPKPQSHYLDATVGGGGHSLLLLEACPDINITAIDQDPKAITAAQARLSSYPQQVNFWQGNFSDFRPGDLKFAGIFADLGVSSPQFDQAERGFSFRYEAPLDMRMNPGQATTAADLINTLSEKELANIFYELGEERFSYRIARRIVAQRPLRTTTQLANLVAHAVPKRGSQKIHPATRVFQALRIAVNRELDVLKAFLDLAPDWLEPGGRIAIISFHSLEDRIVKYAFRDSLLLNVITKKPIIAGPEELSLNPRARSAKLRIAQRLQE